jgi:hypothetical protein
MVAAGLVLSACSGERRPAATDVASALRRSLVERDLSVRSVVCVRRRERVEDAPVHRCNVSFGDPHVQIYCAALIDGELRAREWRQAVRGVLDRERAARECASRLSGAR